MKLFLSIYSSTVGGGVGGGGGGGVGIQISRLLCLAFSVPASFSSPWVPEVFLACGGNVRCWPKADTSSAVGRSREKNFLRWSQKDLPEIGNRARKVSGTQGTFSWLPLFHPFINQCLVIGHFRVAPRQAKREAIKMKMIFFILIHVKLMIARKVLHSF